MDVQLSAAMSAQFDLVDLGKLREALSGAHAEVVMRKNSAGLDGGWAGRLWTGVPGAGVGLWAGVGLKALWPLTMGGLVWGCGLVCMHTGVLAVLVCSCPCVWAC
jgi:hypothetical protein